MKSLVVFFLFSVNIFSQNIDSLSIGRNIPFDSTSVEPTDSVSSDTTGLLRVKKNVAKADTLVPLQNEPLSGNNYIITNKIITHYDYRYAADILKEFPFTFIKDKGFIGQAAETFMYGAGYAEVNYLQDGILYNNRYDNSFDLNNIQFEFVDSIEIIPSPRGFLYGLSPNPVSINFITKDYLSVTPYSRIKYYQGPSGETYVDGLFSALLLKNLNVSFDITNRNFDSTYTNSDFGMWQAKIRLKYFLSNSFNITGAYGYIKSEKGLNGGVNVDSIVIANPDINSLLYDDISAPVNFVNRNQEYIQHYFNLKLLTKVSKNSRGNFDLYFRFNQDKVSAIETVRTEIKQKSKIYGINLKQDFSKDLFKISVIGNFEHQKFNSDAVENNLYSQSSNIINKLSLASIASLNLLNDSLIPSVFYKYFRGRNYGEINNSDLSGAGADVSYKLDNNFKFYLGYSNFKINKDSKRINSFEASANYIEQSLFCSLIIFNRDLITGESYPQITDYKNTTGIGLKLNYQLEKLLIEADGEYFLNAKDNNEMPDLNFMSGIYYKDILFNSNLNLKTGFLFYYTGKQILPQIYSQNVLSYFNNQIDPSLNIDFTLVGEIQKAATVYFTWENLLGKKYFITPFYPMPSRGIRFGIAWELFN
jgi:outer membrane receptor protein involved in Fe transport